MFITQYMVFWLGLLYFCIMINFKSSKIMIHKCNIQTFPMYFNQNVCNFVLISKTFIIFFISLNNVSRPYWSLSVVYIVYL